MHVQEMEAEARKTRLFTDSRFKLKSDQADRSIKEVEAECKKKIALIEVRADEAGNAVKYRLDDFKMQLDQRVTKEYIEVIGKQIRHSIIDSVRITSHFPFESRLSNLRCVAIVRPEKRGHARET